MRLVIATPFSVVVDIDAVAAICAEDESGAFGIWPGHTDFMTALAISVIAWRTQNGAQGQCAVRGGLLLVTEGRTVSVASAEAIIGGDIDQLEAVVLSTLSEAAAAERQASAQAERLHAEAVRRLVGLLRPDSRQFGRAGP